MIDFNKKYSRHSVQEFCGCANKELHWKSMDFMRVTCKNCGYQTFVTGGEVKSITVQFGNKLVYCYSDTKDYVSPIIYNNETPYSNNRTILPKIKHPVDTATLKETLSKYIILL